MTLVMLLRLMWTVVVLLLVVLLAVPSDAASCWLPSHPSPIPRAQDKPARAPVRGD